MKLKVNDIKGSSLGELEVKLPLIEDGRGTQAVHDAVIGHRASQRRGTACTKTMGEVNGSGRKPWRQKGTGRARAGSLRSPLWRGGGVVFGPKPRDFGKKVSRATRQLALRKALSERLKAGDVLIVEDWALASPRTREFVAVLTALEADGGTVLAVSADSDRRLLLASRNVPGVEVTTSASLNTYQVLRSDKLIFSRAAFENVESRLKKE